MVEAGASAPRAARLFHLATLLVTGAVTWCVVSTYTALSHTVDEPTHIAAGMEWLEHGTQRLHPENPPLARVAVGLGLHLAGHRLGTEGRVFQLGTQALYEDGTYRGNLVRARLGTLPFFLVAIFLVWWWTLGLGGARAAFLAAAAFASLPPMIAHAGLATTDVAFVATFLVALYAWDRWLEAPTRARSLGLGLGLGLALITKFSTLLFFPPCALAMGLVRLFAGSDPSRGERVGWRARAGGGALALGLAGLLLWASYGFQFGTFAGPETSQLIATCFPDAGSLGARLAHRVARTPLPAPDCLYGLLFLASHGAIGHPAYLFGAESQHGFMAYYPVAVAVKTPLPFLALWLVALVALARGARGRSRRWLAPAVAAPVFLLVSTRTTINMGLRHVLGVYPLMAITLGLGLELLLRALAPAGRRAAALGIGLLLAWQGLDVVRGHPEHLAYFNPLAGDDPGHVLVDSDLDWGQDALALEAYFRDHPVERLSVAYFGNVRLCELDLPPLSWLAPGEPVRGWVAISEMYFRDHWHLVYDDPCDRRHPTTYERPGGYAWLAAFEPVAFAGRSIRIYHVPEE